MKMESENLSGNNFEEEDREVKGLGEDLHWCGSALGSKLESKANNSTAGSMYLLCNLSLYTVTQKS